MPPLPPSSNYDVHPQSSPSQSPNNRQPVYSTVGSARASTHPAQTDPYSFNVFGVMDGYLKEYTTGFLNGQEAALGQRLTEDWNRKAAKTSSKATSSRSRRYTEQQQQYPSVPSAHELNDTNRHTSTVTNTPSRNSPPQPAPGSGERPSRSSRWPESASSIISSSPSSSRHDRPSSASQRRSGGGIIPNNQPEPRVSPPVPSGYSVAPSESIVRAPSPPSSVVSPLPLQPQEIIPRQATVNPVLAPTPTPYRQPSIRSQQTQPSIDSWGTAPPSHLASGSLVSGLLGLREGIEPTMVGGQGSFVFRELNSHGSSIRSRHSIVDGIDAVLVEVPNPDFSPSRPVQSMVGVLPEEVAPPYVRSPRAGERPPSYRARSEIYSPNDEHQPLSPGRSRHNGMARYRDDVDEVQNYHHYQRSVYDERSSHSSYRVYSSGHEDQYSLRQDEQHTPASSLSSLALRGPPPSRLQPLSLPEESPLPGSMHYTDSEDGLSMDGHRRSASRADSIEETTESFNNALRLDF